MESHKAPLLTNEGSEFSELTRKLEQQNKAEAAKFDRFFSIFKRKKPTHEKVEEEKSTYEQVKEEFSKAKEDFHEHLRKHRKLDLVKIRRCVDLLEQLTSLGKTDNHADKLERKEEHTYFTNALVDWSFLKDNDNLEHHLNKLRTLSAKIHNDPKALEKFRDELSTAHQCKTIYDTYQIESPALYQELHDYDTALKNLEMGVKREEPKAQVVSSLQHARVLLPAQGDRGDHKAVDFSQPTTKLKTAQQKTAAVMQTGAKIIVKNSSEEYKRANRQVNDFEKHQALFQRKNVTHHKESEKQPLLSPKPRTCWPFCC